MVDLMSQHHSELEQEDQRCVMPEKHSVYGLVLLLFWIAGSLVACLFGSLALLGWNLLFCLFSILFRKKLKIDEFFKFPAGRPKE